MAWSKPAAADDDLRPVVVAVVASCGVRCTVSPEAKLSVPLSVSVVYVLAADAAHRHRVVGRTTRCHLVHRQAAERPDAGGDGTLPLVDREVAGEDVAEVGRVLRADRFSATDWPLVSVSGWM